MRRGELIFNLAVSVFPLIISVLAFFIVGIISKAPKLSLSLMAIFYIVGILSLIKSKSSLHKRRVYFSFGSAEMSKPEKRAYIFGYASIAVGVILNIGFILMKAA